MKKAILLFLTLTYFTNYAQTKFEKGYFINNSGERIECFIKNLDLLNSPKDFTYKLSETSKPYKATIHDAKVFEIYDIVKYERHTVDIDRSSELYYEISATRKAEFEEEQLFLKVLIEGKASLYHYAETNLSRFFYKNINSNLEQLVYKSYKENFDFDIKKNERYKQQLMNNLNCNNLKKTKFTNLKYQKNSLINFFIDYNKCIDAKYINYDIKKTKESKSYFNLNIRPGINTSTVFSENGTSQIRNLDYGTKTTARLGLELELVLGFNNNKWALIVEPTYQSYFSETEDSLNRKKTINYTSIDIPFGIRHYMFLNDTSKFFINALIITDFPFNSEVDVDNSNRFEIDSVLNYGIGLGYKYNDRYSIEFKLISSRELLGNFFRFNVGYRSVSVILGYTIF
jgi:hypothetical protein